MQNIQNIVDQLKDTALEDLPLAGISSFVCALIVACSLSLVPWTWADGNVGLAQAQASDNNAGSASTQLSATEYCSAVANRIRQQWQGLTVADSDVAIDIVVDRNGDVQSAVPWKYSRGSAAQQQTASAVVMSLKNLGAPPGNWFPVVMRMNVCPAHGIEVSREDVDLMPYMANLQRRIKQTWTPPAGMEHLRSVILFKVNRDGSVSGLQIERSSKNETVDRAALNAVQAAAPFAAMPDGAPAHADVQIALDSAFAAQSTTPHLSVDVIVETPADPGGKFGKELATVFSRVVETKLGSKKDIFEVHDRDSEIPMLKKDRNLKLKPLNCVVVCTLQVGPMQSPDAVSLVMVDARVVDVRNSVVLAAASTQVQAATPFKTPTIQQLRERGFSESELGRLFEQAAGIIADKFAAEAPSIARRLRMQ